MVLNQDLKWIYVLLCLKLPGHTHTEILPNLGGLRILSGECHLQAVLFVAGLLVVADEFNTLTNSGRGTLVYDFK